MTLLYEDGRQGEINLITSQDNIIHLGNIDFENLTVNLKPKTVAAGEKAPSLGETTAPFGDLYLQGNTLTISTRSIGITEQSGTEYLDFGSNVVIGSTVISGTRLLAFQDQLKTTGLTDVTITGIEDGNVLEWNQDTSKCIHAPFSLDPADLDVSKKNIGELYDVEPNSYVEGMMWQYSPSADKWTSLNPNDLDLDYPKARTFSVNSGTAAENPTGTVRYSSSLIIPLFIASLTAPPRSILLPSNNSFLISADVTSSSSFSLRLFSIVLLTPNNCPSFVIFCVNLLPVFFANFLFSAIAVRLLSRMRFSNSCLAAISFFPFSFINWFSSSSRYSTRPVL